MHSFILEDWLTVRGPGGDTITQDESHWLDLEAFQDAVSASSAETRQLPNHYVPDGTCEGRASFGVDLRPQWPSLQLSRADERGHRSRGSSLVNRRPGGL
jgi:hypothetical protein